MSGATSLGQQVLAHTRGSTDPSMVASLDHLGMQVTAENVLQIRAAFLAEADRLDTLLGQHGQALRIRAPAADPVSVATEAALNPKLDRLAAQYRAYVNALYAAGDVLTASARAYGHTEQQITDSFQPREQDRGVGGTPR